MLRGVAEGCGHTLRVDWTTTPPADRHTKVDGAALLWLQLLLYLVLPQALLPVSEAVNLFHLSSGACSTSVVIPVSPACS